MSYKVSLQTNFTVRCISSTRSYAEYWNISDVSANISFIFRVNIYRSGVFGTLYRAGRQEQFFLRAKGIGLEAERFLPSFLFFLSLIPTFLLVSLLHSLFYQSLCLCFLSTVGSYLLFVHSFLPSFFPSFLLFTSMASLRQLTNLAPARYVVFHPYATSRGSLALSEETACHATTVLRLPQLLHETAHHCLQQLLILNKIISCLITVTFPIINIITCSFLLLFFLILFSLQLKIIINPFSSSLSFHFFPSFASFPFSSFTIYHNLSYFSHSSIFLLFSVLSFVVSLLPSNTISTVHLHELFLTAVVLVHTDPAKQEVHTENQTLYHLLQPANQCPRELRTC